ncbi:hypothetical protein C8D94_103380 [Marinirhabdus gelatinilytica]|uniref:Uncharacterized protein n=1 Tax=Marinirhabdus gelatinilytica TaxID=1703343 RepID=A0A370QB04_9FLAO|nr:hypothetical protein C8D94_103380 [Marinirhabdus gelatinilytica]
MIPKNNIYTLSLPDTIRAFALIEEYLCKKTKISAYREKPQRVTFVLN